jgi:hypothetical protein
MADAIKASGVVDPHISGTPQRPNGNSSLMFTWQR